MDLLKPMNEQEMLDALRGQQESPVLRAVLCILKAGEVDAGMRFRIGQPDAERRDVASIRYAYEEAQELVLEKLDKANGQAYRAMEEGGRKRG